MSSVSRTDATLWERRYATRLTAAERQRLPACHCFREQRIPEQWSQVMRSSIIRSKEQLREIQSCAAGKAAGAVLYARPNDEWIKSLAYYINNNQIGPLFRHQRVYVLPNEEDSRAYFKLFYSQEDREIQPCKEKEGFPVGAEIGSEWIAHRIWHDITCCNQDIAAAGYVPAALMMIAARSFDPLDERCVIKFGLLTGKSVATIPFDQLSSDECQTIPAQVLQMVVYLDLIAVNGDRTPSNLLFQLEEGRVTRVCPIDHEFILSPSGQGGRYCWLNKGLDSLLEQPWKIAFCDLFLTDRWLHQISKKWVTKLNGYPLAQQVPSVKEFVENASKYAQERDLIWQVSCQLVHCGRGWGLTPLELGILFQQTKCPEECKTEGYRAHHYNAVDLVLEGVRGNRELAKTVRNFVLSFQLFKKTVTGSLRDKAQGAWGQLQKSWLEDLQKHLHKTGIA